MAFGVSVTLQVSLQHGRAFSEWPWRRAIRFEGRDDDGVRQQNSWLTLGDILILWVWVIWESRELERFCDERQNFHKVLRWRFISRTRNQKKERTNLNSQREEVRRRCKFLWEMNFSLQSLQIRFLRNVFRRDPPYSVPNFFYFFQEIRILSLKMQFYGFSGHLEITDTSYESEILNVDIG